MNFIQKYQSRKRQHSEIVSEQVEDYFNKRYDFFCEDESNLPEQEILFTENKWEIYQFQIMKYQLNQIKGQLSEFNLEEWSRHTKSRDPASYIFRQLKYCIKPEILTQAWCKFYECISQFPIINQTILSMKKLNSFHLCEAPGAFISALNHFLATNYTELEWNWLSNSLNPEYEGNDLTHMIPDKKLMKFTYKHWKFGTDDSGDLTKFYNYEALVSEAKRLGEILLVTADGSIDCMSDPGEQESTVEYLHFCEVITALTILSPGGSFIVKMFTMFENGTICLLYLLYNCFSSLHVFKPCTSKSGNSEVYVVCLNYKNKEKFTQILDKLLSHYKNPNSDISMFPKNAIPNKFISQIEESAMFFMSKQIKTINDNIYCFNSILPNEFRKNEEVKNVISKYFINKFRIKRMHESRYLTDRKPYFNQMSEIIAFDDLPENDTDHILYSNCNNKRDDSIIELHYVIGKEIPKVLYSDFCDINFLRRFHNTNDMFSTFTFMEFLKKFNSNCAHIINIHYSNNNILNSTNLFQNLHKTINIINYGDNMIIIGSLFLTRFEAGLLFLLLCCFTSVQYYYGILMLKNANEKLSNIRELFHKIKISLNNLSSVENKDFVPSVLNFLPNTLLRSENYFKFLFDYNNSTFDFFFKHTETTS